MESLLRQSRSMCPFLSKTSPATLRSLSTTTASHDASPGGSSMSNLQVYARRCPIMGKALAVQSARTGNTLLAGAYGGMRAYHSRAGRARLHTSTSKEAQAVNIEDFRPKQGRFTYVFLCTSSESGGRSKIPSHSTDLRFSSPLPSGC